MGLRIAIGRAGCGKTRLCLDEIRERLRESPEGRPLVLILPEHATFEAERELAATPGLGGFARAHVVGFRRLAHRVLLETGGALRPHISELGKRMALSRLMLEKQKELKAFYRASRQRTFAETLSGMIKEFKTYSISTRQLATAEGALEPGPLKDKLHDLSLLYEGFNQFLAGRYTDPEDYLALLAEKIPHSSLLAGAEVWVDGFIWFNPRELAVLAQILTTAAAVTVTLCLDDPGSPDHQAETALFHRQWQTRYKLLHLASSLGIAKEELELVDAGRFAGNPLLGHIERQFFTFPPAPWAGGDSSGLVVAEAANRRVEVEGMARDIIRLCREKEYRWRDIAILIRDAESYGELVETVLTDYDIPFFSDRQRQPVHHPMAELVRSALETVLGRWSYDPLFRCFKTDLFPVDRSEIDELENYVLEFGIRGSRWSAGEPWNFVRRLSLDEDADMTTDQQQYLERIDDIRRRAAAPLLEFDEKIKQAATVTDMTAVLYALLAGLDVPGQLAAWADKAEADGDLEQAREHRQIWNSVVQLFDELVDTSGGDTVSLSDYTAVLNDGLEGLKLSLIPPGLDHITVSPLDQTTVANVRAVYVPGVNDGVLPMRSRGEGLLTDAERAKAASAGLELAPGAAADAFAERFIVYTALTRSREYLWVSYPLADGEGRGLTPSLVVLRLKELTGAKITPLPLEPAPGTEKQYIVHAGRSVSALAAGLRTYKSSGAISPIWCDVYNWALARPELRNKLHRSLAGLFHSNKEEALPRRLAERIYARSGKLRGSVTRFESFRACPFRHFAQYGLSLKERAIFRLAAPDFGQFLHAALKAFGERMHQNGRPWGSITDAEYGAICATIVAELAPKLQNEILLSSGRHQHLLGRLERTVGRSVRRLIQFDRVSRFKPIALEKAFGRSGDALPALVYPLPDGRTLEIAGQIDRLDSAEQGGRTYLLVIDYKSGGAWLKLIDVYHGLKLQLLTYLLVAQHVAAELVGADRCEPAGILYYFLKNPSFSSPVMLSPETAEQKLNSLLKMPGWTLADPEVVRLIDGSMEAKSEFLRVGLKKNNEFSAYSQAYVKTADEFKTLLEHTEKVLVETAESILAGDVSISPYYLDKRSPCSICRYSPVCQFDQLLPENSYRQLPQYDDGTIMVKLTDGKEEKK